MEKWETKSAIVILNYNGADLTIECIRSLRECSELLNIVVVDNCSTDQSYEKIKKIFEKDKYTYIIANNENAGYAAGNNVGLRYIEKNLEKVETVCIMNPDIKVESVDTLYHLYEALGSEEKLAVITAQTIYNGKLRYPNDFGWKHLTTKYMLLGGTLLGKIIKTSIRYSSIDVNPENIAYADIVQGCFFMAKLKLFKEVDYFDEGTFLYEEEAILGKKMQRAGYKEAVLINEFVYHNHHEKDKKLIKRKNKIFDMTCFYNSRKHYVKFYSEISEIKKRLICTYLDLDLFIKKMIIRL